MPWPWSLETIKGWEGHHARLERWYQKVMQNGAGRGEEAFDDVLAFFQCCFSLRDWLIVWGGVERDRIDSLIAGSRAMCICRDICNRSKHGNIRKGEEGIDRYYSIHREYDPSGNKLVVVVGSGEKFDLLDIMKDCLAFWQTTINITSPVATKNPFTRKPFRSK
jgi:hypothetical protein